MSRADRLRELMAAAGLDSLLVHNLTNIRYLTGFTGSNATVLVTPARVLLCTDGRYTEQARDEVGDSARVLISRTPIPELLGAAGETGRLGFETHGVSYATGLELLDLRPEVLPSADLVAQLRRSKDQVEITTITSACAITEQALTEAVAAGVAGLTEQGLARRILMLMLEGGADDRAFPTIVASGPNSAIPHHAPSDRVIAPGDVLKVDMGAVIDGYHSDLTRTFLVGASPSPELQEHYDLVAQAAAVSRDRLRAGEPAADVYGVARECFGPLAGNFTHGLGHGVGLQIHEAPIMGPATQGNLVDGDIVTVEPGLYFPGQYGIRIEDTLVVTQTGARSLTHMSRDLVAID